MLESKARRQKRWDSRIQIKGKLIAPPPNNGGPSKHNINTKTNWGCQCSYCTNSNWVKWWNKNNPTDLKDFEEKCGHELWKELKELEFI